MITWGERNNFLPLVVFLQIKKLIAKNKTELGELVSQLNLSTNSEDFENWAVEITACGQRTWMDVSSKYVICMGSRARIRCSSRMCREDSKTYKEVCTV